MKVPCSSTRLIVLIDCLRTRAHKMTNFYKPLDKCVHGITVGGIGNAKNCGHCNEGYCEHGKKVEGLLFEAEEGRGAVVRSVGRLRGMWQGITQCSSLTGRNQPGIRNPASIHC